MKHLLRPLFYGGVHPHSRKEMSTQNVQLREILPETVVIPLRQHIGVACKALVQAGDMVLCGQKIGDGDGLCVPVHASVSGTVLSVEMRPHPGGGEELAVVIQSDGTDTAVPDTPDTTPLAQMDADQILVRIREAGIVGMGGAAFPGNVKAMGAMGKVDTLIANGCECEPYITADDVLLRTDARRVLEGMCILRHVVECDRAILAVEDNKREAISQVQKLLPEYPGISLRILPTKYPQGAEKQLIQSLTGREVPPGQLPIAVGCAVFNVSTYAAIADAVRWGRPITRRIVTVSGEAIAQPANFIARIGTPFRVLIEAADGLQEQTERVISGGPMMGVAQSDLNVPTVKATNSILCLLKDKNGAAENPVCLRCGKCVSACPMRLQPLYLYRYDLAGDTKELARLHVTDCMECGACAFTCPGKLPLVEHIRHGKKLCREANAK